MNKTEARELLHRLDQNTLEKRVERLSQFSVLSHPAEPELVFDYMVEAKMMFVNGHFIGAVLTCAAIVEMILLDQLTKTGKSSGLGKHPGLKSLIDRANQQSVLNDAEAQLIYALNDLRIEVIHAKADQLKKRAKDNWPLESKPPASFYLTPLYGTGLEQDALGHLLNVRKLIAKLYPVED